MKIIMTFKESGCGQRYLPVSPTEESGRSQLATYFHPSFIHPVSFLIYYRCVPTVPGYRTYQNRFCRVPTVCTVWYLPFVLHLLNKRLHPAHFLQVLLRNGLQFLIFDPKKVRINIWANERDRDGSAIYPAS